MTADTPMMRHLASEDRPAVLIVTLSLERGGTERHLAMITPRLVAKGWRVAIYCLATRGVMADEVAAAGVKVIDPPVGGWASLRGPLQSLRLLLSAVKLAAYMAYRRPMIVHTFLPAPYLVAGPIALVTQRPVTIMSRRNLRNYLKHRPRIARIERMLHKRMTALMANSQTIARELVDEEAAPEDRTGVLYNGTELTPFDRDVDRVATRAGLGIEPGAFVAVLVANIIPYKGHGDLIRGLARVADRMPRGWRVLCVGRDDGTQAICEALAATLGIGDNVAFLGSRADVPTLLMSADCGLSCSHEEGFSNAVIEGMAAGLPMVVTDVGGNPEAVVHEVTGLIVPPRDPARLGAAILRMAADPQLAERFGEAGRRRAQALFSIDACVDKYDRLYRGLLAGETAAALTRDVTGSDSSTRGRQGLPGRNRT